MPRNIRQTVFLSQEERELILSITPDDVAIGTTIRRLAMKQAEWYAVNSRKVQGILRKSSSEQVGDAVAYDYADGQG